MTDYNYQPIAPPDYEHLPPQDTSYPTAVAPPSIDPGYPPAQYSHYPPSNYPAPPPQDFNYPPPPVAGPGYNSQCPPNVGFPQFDQTYPIPQEATPPARQYAPSKAPRQPLPHRASHQAKRGHQARPARNSRPTYAAHNPRYPPPRVPPS